MKLLRLNDIGDDVKKLQTYLNRFPNTNLTVDGMFGTNTLSKVLWVQETYDLDQDGLVGFDTWSTILFVGMSKLTDEVYNNAAYVLSCDVAAIKAVKEVETGGLEGFVAPSKPTILFEGHIFWKLLLQKGKDPNKYLNDSTKDILYKSWTKKYYKGGIKEYDRLNKAIQIDPSCAYQSASWGMFQIMGMNYKTCRCEDVDEFVRSMSNSECDQLLLFLKFIYTNKLGKYLQNQQWAEFACRYNGPGYKSNNYDVKLANAFNKYK